jgi:hypothetical protein
VFASAMQLVLFAVLLFPLATAQASSDWRSRYGLPESERYVVDSGTMMTVFYSPDGRTCRAIIEPKKPPSREGIEQLLAKIIPLGERGKKIRSIGLSSSANRIESEDFDRVSIALIRRDQEITAAKIYWKGVSCRFPE